MSCDNGLTEKLAFLTLKFSVHSIAQICPIGRASVFRFIWHVLINVEQTFHLHTQVIVEPVELVKQKGGNWEEKEKLQFKLDWPVTDAVHPSRIFKDHLYSILFYLTSKFFKFADPLGIHIQPAFRSIIWYSVDQVSQELFVLGARNTVAQTEHSIYLHVSHYQSLDNQIWYPVVFLTAEIASSPLRHSFMLGSQSQR